ncbi:hypothetical protein [uncultured Mediterranean phage uvMED]|nr:hypothetical protein [uncultured Mediterranean phage uvMED]BAQ89755.1 hypothetical protein [uncultured Mediterranean phage uvMED]BAQ89787.1 hypothetical protein [uncultured Mediterranean phage uvMED]BAR19214.1 hypothetical protein [uncultured Mediterranean phage uvMED]BAR19278.1 hypothetical protein [uncultured Mediterranean phage uvMED]|tara:strand:- start:648 stop:1130 length:483 start_codon:yes stop_codon:yes gene_type:complete
MSILKVDTINEKTSGNGVHITGHVIQVVSNTYATETASGSSSYTDTGLAATITPKFATSKILVLCNMCAAGVMQNGGADAQGLFKLVRGSTDLNEAVNRSYDYGNSGSIIFGQFLMSWSDSPSTTSATTYKLQQKCTAGTNVRICEGNVSSLMHLMEIAQ